MLKIESLMQTNFGCEGCEQAKLEFEMYSSRLNDDSSSISRYQSGHLSDDFHVI